MSTQADKLNAKLDEIAERATQGGDAMREMVAHANAKGRTVHDHARDELEKVGRTVREATERRMRARE
jgi:DNA-binding ferritin-like protein